jgi:hypothetical protein
MIDVIILICYIIIMERSCAGCNHLCHCRFETYSTPPYSRYHSYHNKCKHNTINKNLQQLYIPKHQIKTFHGKKYNGSVCEANEIRGMDESDYIDETYATHRIDRVQDGFCTEYKTQYTTGFVGNKYVNCESKVPVVVPIIRDKYVPTEGRVERKIAILVYTIDKCVCDKCTCGAAGEEANRQRIEQDTKIVILYEWLVLKKIIRL